MLREEYTELSNTETTTAFYDGQQCILTITETMKDDTIYMSFQGELRSDVANPLLDELTALIIADKSINLNFRDVSFISSAIMFQLLNAQRKIDEIHKGKMILSEVPSPVFDAFRKVGLEDLLWFEE